MAKNNDTAITKMTRKAKILNFLKIFGICFAGVMLMVAGVVLYVWATGGFNPPYEPLSSWYWASEARNQDSETDPEEKTEFVIDGNKEIELDAEGHQRKDNDGNLIWKQKTDKQGNPIFESLYIIPNRGCTELDAVVEITFNSNPSLYILQLIEDDNVKAVKPENTEEQNDSQSNNQQQDAVYYTKYNVKINSPIYLKPLTTKKLVNGKEIETNVGGWVKLTATQGLITTSCWVFVDSAVTDLKLELNQDLELEQDIYNIYPNSTLSVSSIISPNGCMVLPSTTNPQGKTATAFTNKKSVYYQTSNTEIASIDKFGNITIMPHKEGETFSVNAYIVAKYNNVGNEPNIQDYEGDPSQDAIVPYTRDFDKIRVWSNTLTFKINEISVDGLTTGSKSTVFQPYSVFESGTINYSDSETNPRKNFYYVDLLFSNNVDESYKNTLLSKIELYIGFEDGNAETIPDSVKSVKDIVMNGKKIEDASKYISFEKINGVYHYTVNEYSESKFYIFLYYEMQEEQKILWDYIPISLKKEKVTNVETAETAISLLYNSDGPIETYPLNNFATITPNNSTYKNVLYFVPSTTDCIETDDSIKAYIAGKDCVAIAAKIKVPDQDNNLVDSFDYYTLKPKGNEKTFFYAAVVRTTVEMDREEFIQCLLDSESRNEYLILSEDRYVEIEFSSEFVNVTIAKKVEITGIDSTVSTVIENNDPDYNFAKDCDIFARVYKGEDIDITITYDGTTDSLENGRLTINLLDGADATIASLTNQDNTVDGSYKFKIITNKVGSIKYHVLYNGDPKYTIGVVVLTTELSGLNLQTNNNDLTLDFIAGNDGIANGYKWNDFNLSLEYNSPKTNDVNFEIETYAVVDDYVSILDSYIGRDYTEVIDGLPEDINTIEKLIAKLTKTESVIKVFANQISNPDANIVVDANEEISFAYKFVSVGAVFVVAHSISTEIYSNPILVNVNCPEIKVINSETGVELTPNQTKTVVSYGQLTSIDNHITPAKQINLFGTGTDFIKFVAEANDKVYDLNKLVFFKFEEQTASANEYTSTKSGAKISLSGTHSILTLCDISGEISENIVVFTNFGYLNDEFYQYNLKPNYKFILNNQNKVYHTPNLVDLFTGTSSVCGDIIFTNYDYTNPVASVGNKLYLPNGYVNSINELKTKMPAEYVDSFNYEDEQGQGDYYHIYLGAINVASDGNNTNNYDRSGYYLINLKYKTTNQKIDIRFTTAFGYLLSTKITVDAGVVYNGATKKNIQSSILSEGENISGILSSFDVENDDFNVEITNVDFAVSATTSEDLSFYYVNANKKYVKTFVEVLEEDIHYKLESEIYSYNNNYYVKTEDEQILPQKDYYIKNNNEFIKDENPINENIGYYYEEFNINNYTQYFINTSDVGIVAEKKYYEKNNNQFEEVELPNVNNIADYYEKVYVDSSKVYYGRETHYERIETGISQDYISSYYVAIFKKASSTFDEYETYYVINNDSYVQVDNPSASEIANYFVKDYMPATAYNPNTEYYFKMNYKQLLAGDDITEAFEIVTISLEKSGTNHILKASEEDKIKLQNLTDSINLSFVISIKINNISSGGYDTYKMKYSINIV